MGAFVGYIEIVGLCHFSVTQNNQDGGLLFMAIQYTATGLLNKLSESNFSYTNAYRKKVHESNRSVEALQVDVAGLKKTMKDLGKCATGLSSMAGLDNLKIYYKKNAVETKGFNSKSRLEKQFKNLTKIYNSMNKDAEEVSDEELGKQMKKLEKLFDENDKDLKKIGLKKKDGKYVFDSEIFADADNKVIKRLSEGRNSFVKQADKIMRNMEARLDDLQYSIVERNMMRTTKYDTDQISLANNFVFEKGNVTMLQAYSKFFEAGGIPEAYKEECENELKYFTEFACNLANRYDNEDYNKLKALCESKKEELVKVGLIFQDDGNGKSEMVYNDATDFDSPEFQNAYVSLFGENSEFVKKITEHCDKGYLNVIEPEKINVSIVDMQA